ncbi:DUF3710 domain-containing protein [Plantactinospora sp. GCM10030261]|uniref:DUF3710 domain-containing protein n=1 Tax=Plantactinospora sp. GCM10030261 TaxID=3273420 RepID=UPI00361F3CE9
MIFSKGRRESGRHAQGDQRGPVVAEESVAVPERGPYDIADAPDDVKRLDLGSLHIPAVPEVEVRMQTDPNGTIQQVVLVHGESALQLGAFAAPRSEGVWDDVRADLLASLGEQGATTSEVDGAYGVELRATVRSDDGPVELRFLGIDGPRWMVRAVYQGRVATDPTAAGPLARALENLAVDRGEEPRPVLEPLPLRLPKEFADQVERERAAGGAPVDGVLSGQQHPHRAEPGPPGSR